MNLFDNPFLFYHTLQRAEEINNPSAQSVGDNALTVLLGGVCIPIGFLFLGHWYWIIIAIAILPLFLKFIKNKKSN